MVILIFLIFCLKVNYPSYLPSINVNITLSSKVYSSPSNVDKGLLAILDNSSNIIITENSCSYIEEGCVVNVYKFNNSFQLMQPKHVIKGKSHSYECSSFIETSDHYYLFSLVDKFDPNLIKYLSYKLNENLIHASMTSITNESLIESAGPILENLGTKSVRFFYNFKSTTTSGIEQVNYYDLSKDLAVTTTANFDSLINRLKCTSPIPSRISFAGRFGENYYYTGYCIGAGTTSSTTFGLIVQYSENFNYIGNYINTEEDSVYYGIQFRQPNKLLVSYSKSEKGSIDFLGMNMDLNQISSDILTSFNYNSGISELTPVKSIQSFVFIDSTQTIYGFSKTGITSPVAECNPELIFQIQIPTSPGNPPNPISGHMLYPSDPNVYTNHQGISKIHSSLIINSTHILSTVSSTMYGTDPNTMVQLIQYPSFNSMKNIVFGGNGDYQTANIIRRENGNYLIHGKEGAGLYLLEANVSDFSFKKESKYFLEFPISSHSMLELGNGKSIIFGSFYNYSNQLGSFLSEVSYSLFTYTIRSPFIEDTVEINCGLNINSSYFAIAGTKIINSYTSTCFYMIINIDYESSILSTKEISPAERIKCRINDMILSSNNIVFAVGHTSIPFGGILITYMEKPIYRLIALGRQLELNSIIEMNSNLFLTTGNIIDGYSTKPYFASFHSDLSLNSTLIDTSSSPSKNFKSIKLNEKFAATAGQCQEIACIKFAFVEESISISEVVTYENTSSSSGFTGLILLQDLQIFTAGFKWNSTTSSNNLLFALFNLLPFCPNKKQTFKKENFMCYDKCNQGQSKGSQQCTLLDQEICTKCMLLKDHKCSDNQFDDQKQYCGNILKFKLISKTASYSPYTSKNKLYLKRKLSQTGKRMLDSSSKDGSITAEFETTPQYRNYPISLQLVDSKGSLSNEISYSNYQFLDTKLLINQVTILGIGDYQSIQIDLTRLQITNSLGVPLDNPVLLIPIQELSDSQGLNNLQNLASNIADFLSENRNAFNLGIGVIGLGSGLLNLNLFSLLSIAEILQFLCLYALVSISYYPNILNTLFKAQSLFNFNFIPLPEVLVNPCSGFQESETIPGNIGNHPSVNCVTLFCNIYSMVFVLLTPIGMVILSYILPSSISKRLKEMPIWNGFLDVIQGAFIDISLLVVLQIFFGTSELNSLGFGSYIFGVFLFIFIAGFLYFQFCYTFFHKKSLDEKKDEQYFGSLAEGLMKEKSSDQTHTIKQLRIHLSVIFLFCFHSSPLAQTASFMILSLGFCIWIFYRKPFDTLLVNIREITIECAIILTHISFLLLAVFEYSADSRPYFELTSFFSIILCILIEFIFNIVSFMIDFIQFIISLFQKKKEDKDTKKEVKNNDKNLEIKKNKENEEFKSNKRLKFSSFKNHKREIQKIGQNQKAKIKLIVRTTNAKNKFLDNSNFNSNFNSIQVKVIEPEFSRNNCQEKDNIIEEEKISKEEELVNKEVVNLPNQNIFQNIFPEVVPYLLDPQQIIPNSISGLNLNPEDSRLNFSGSQEMKQDLKSMKSPEELMPSLVDPKEIEPNSRTKVNDGELFPNLSIFSPHKEIQNNSKSQMKSYYPYQALENLLKLQESQKNAPSSKTEYKAQGEDLVSNTDLNINKKKITRVITAEKNRKSFLIGKNQDVNI